MTEGNYKAGKKTVADGVHVIGDHLHSAAKVYPTLAAAVTVTAVDDGGTWDLGVFAQIVPAATINAPFDVHYIYIAAVAVNTDYELILV